MIWASSSNFDGGSTGLRFSTLNVAIASSLWLPTVVTSRASPLRCAVGALVTSSLKLPNE